MDRINTPLCLRGLSNVMESVEMNSDKHSRLIALVNTMPRGSLFTSAELARKLNQEVRGIGRRLGDIDQVEKVPLRQAGTWRKL